MLSFESPVVTPWHKVPVTVKFLGVCVCSVLLFVFDAVALQVAALLVCCLFYLLGGTTFFKAGLNRITFLWPIILVILIWHGLTDTAIQGVSIAFRLTTIVALSNLMTMTTRLSDLLGLVQRCLKPFRRLGFNTRPVEIAVALVVRFAPVLIEKGSALISAWRARSVKSNHWRIIFPLCLVAIDDAEHVAQSLKARGGTIKVTDD